MADAIDHFADPLGRQPMQLVVSEWPPADREQRFRAGIGEWTHARSQSAGQYHTLHYSPDWQTEASAPQCRDRLCIQVGQALSPAKAFLERFIIIPWPAASNLRDQRRNGPRAIPRAASPLAAHHD